ncbi:MAG: hypothetical protein GKR87_14235 [Kiritimatiellae bacterium]|nr:hypothetical protein [Kiritimatiellia bacterium]
MGPILDASAMGGSACGRRHYSLWFLLLLLSFSSFAQTPYHYAVEEVGLGQVISRGTTEEKVPAGTLILAPNILFRYWLYEVAAEKIGYVDFTTPGDGRQFTIPAVNLGISKASDYDNDGLDDDAEFVIGTDPNNSDTDGDQIFDGAEVAQGLDPSDGNPTQLGLISSVDTLGMAMDIQAFNDIAIIADDGGVSVFNVFNRMAPIIISQVSTPGQATAISHTKNYIAVADGNAGLEHLTIEMPL